MPIVIDLKLDDGSVSPAFQRVERIFEKLDKLETRILNATQALADATKDAAAGFGSVANQANRAAGAANRAASATQKIKAPPRFQVTGDPQDVINRYGAAAMAGDAGAQKWVLAAQTAMNRQKRVGNIVNPPDPMMQAVMRSRFVQQGNKMVGMPLGVDIMKLMATGNGAGLGAILNGGLAGGGGGIAALAGPVAIAGAAVTAFSMAVKKGVEVIKAATAANIMLGGSGRQSHAAARAAGFAGVNVGSITGNIGQGGLAGAIGAGMGVSPVRGFFGDTNDAAAFLRIVNAIGKMSYADARRYAIGLGDPNLAKYALLNEGTRNRLASSQTGGISGSDMRASAEMDANLSLLGDSIGRFARTAASPFLKFASVQLDQLSRTVSLFSLALSVGFAPVKSALDWLADWYNRITGNKSGRSPMDKNTKAIEDLTQTIKDGTYGGGDRAANARPRGMRGSGFDSNDQYRELRTSPI